MSATLGPIHQWMYDKVLTREALIKRIIDTAETNNWEPLVNGKPINSFTSDSFPPLDEVIDLSNIHSSLSGMINNVESRYAELIVGLTNKDNNRFNKILDTVHKFGQENNISREASVQEAFQAINDTLLDGMPCDRAVNVTCVEDDKVAFEQTMDLHTEYWKKYNGDGDDFYELRDAFISGMLEGSGHHMDTVGDRMYELY